MTGTTDKAPVLVCGEALVDVFDSRVVAGGAPFNLACHLAGLGLAPRFISRVGDDTEADCLRNTAARTGLAFDAVQIDPERPTGRVIVHQHAVGHAFEIAADQAYDHIDAETVLHDQQVCEVLATTTGWLYHGTLALRSPDTRKAIMALRAAARCRVFIDMNWRDAGPAPHEALQALSGADVLKLNAEELSRVLGWLGLDDTRALMVPVQDEHRQAMAALMRMLRIGTVLVTHGAEGAVLWRDAGRCAQVREIAPIRDMVDTVGTGDAFAAAMLAALVRSLPFSRALSLAVEFAAAVCSIRGATPAQAGFHAPWRAALAASGGVLPKTCI
jgi:fructokinase